MPLIIALHAPRKSLLPSAVLLVVGTFEEDAVVAGSPSEPPDIRLWAAALGSLVAKLKKPCCSSWSSWSLVVGAVEVAPGARWQMMSSGSQSSQYFGAPSSS